MRNPVAAAFCVCVLICLTASPSYAQYTPGFGLSDPATGETYKVEVGGFLWNPAPDIRITTAELPVTGPGATTIDFVTDLGIERKYFKQLKLALRPARKHKLRFEYTPMSYSAESVVRRNVEFRGVVFPFALPVETEFTWKAYRFAYEFDFVYRDRGFVGLLLEAKYTDVQASLRNRFSNEFIHAQAPIPAVGIIGRGYVAPNISITGEFSGFRLPKSFDEEYSGNYYDFDLYGTVNFSDNFGAQLGYRSLDVSYSLERDEGTLTMKGLYFGGVARF